MTRDIQIATLESGALRVEKFGNPGHEAVLALPLSRLLVRMVRVSSGEDPIAVATPILQALSPYPDEPLTVGFEKVQEADDGSMVVLAAALPESSAEDVGELLDAQKLSVTRVDLLALGELRGVWNRFDSSDGKRRLIQIKSADCLSLIVLDGDLPVAIRGITDETDFVREKMLLLLEAEMFGGAKELAETIEVDAPEDALSGIAERSADATALNALPASWADVLAESRFKRKLLRNLSIALGLWGLTMGVLFGVPVAYGFMRDHQISLSKQKVHARQYNQVHEKKIKVEAFKPYSDRSRSALEIMKAVSDRLPAGITLSDWNFDAKVGLSIHGDAETDGDVLSFKDTMEALALDEAGEDKVFKTVRLGNLNLLKGKQRFDLELGFEEKEAEQ